MLHRSAFPLSLRSLLTVLVVGIALSASSLLHAQSVVYTGSTPGLDFGSVNVCPSGATTPAPCSETQTLIYKVTGSGTLGTPKVVTLGAPNLDYTLADGSTCTGAVTEGATCSVNVNFGPLYPGARNGAAEIVDGSGNVLATTFLRGVGEGPQIGFSPSAQRSIGAFAQPFGLAVDGLGNLYAAETYDNKLIKTPISGGPHVAIGTGLSAPWGVAVDGAGNVIISNKGEYTIVEIPASGAPQFTLPFISNESSLLQAAVDRDGLRATIPGR